MFVGFGFPLETMIAIFGAPVYSPSLNFTDSRNSQYIPIISAFA